MIGDRYTKTVLTVIAVALIAIAARPCLPSSSWLTAVQPERADAQPAATPKDEVTVPKACCKFVAFGNNNFLLEGADHVLRIVDVEGQPPEYPRIKVQVNWQ